MICFLVWVHPVLLLGRGPETILTQCYTQWSLSAWNLTACTSKSTDALCQVFQVNRITDSLLLFISSPSEQMNTLHCVVGISDRVARYIYIFVKNGLEIFCAPQTPVSFVVKTHWPQVRGLT